MEIPDEILRKFGCTKKKKKKGFFEDETELKPAHPIYINYYYLINGKPMRSEISGTIFQFKRYLEKRKKMRVNSIRRCNLIARGLCPY